MNVWYKYRSIITIIGCVVLFFLKNNTVICQTINCNSDNSIYLAKLYSNTIQDRFAYATVKDYSGNMVTLYADIYRPATISSNQRATILIFTGGGFKNTYITSAVLKAWAKNFTARGYNVIIPMYRTGWEDYDRGLCGGGTITDFEDAMYRALQDERLLLQHLNDNAMRWQIDKDAVFEMGYSAGALLILSNISGSDVLFTSERMNRLGEISASDINIQGIITLTGAVISRNYNESIPALLLFHGTCDNAVPFEEGRLAGCANLSYLYGSSTIYEDLEAAHCVQMEVFCNYGHDFRNASDNEELAEAFTYISDEASSFMYNILCKKNCPTIAIAANDTLLTSTSYTCHPNIGNSYCKKWSSASERIIITPTVLNGDNTLKILCQTETDYPPLTFTISDITGRVVSSRVIYIQPGNTEQTIYLPHSLQKGLYTICLRNEKHIVAHDKLLIMTK